MRLKNNYRTIFLITAWIVIHGVLLYHFGIVTKGESEKYIREANNLMTDGRLSSSSYWLYLVQISLIYATFKLNIGFEGIIAIQLSFSLIAMLCFFRFARSIFHERTGFFATIWFLLNLPLHQFNTFLQTDSLFYSFTIIFSCYLLQIKSLSIKHAILIAAALMLLSITRPTGMFFLPATFLYLYFRFFRRIRLPIKIASSLIFAGIFLYALNKAIGSGGELDFMLPARTENIICGVPTTSGAVAINEIENGNSLRGLFYYVTHNFSQYIRLAWQRSIAFFGVKRWYYSSMHNLYLIGLFFPAYMLALLSMRYWFRKNAFFLLYSLTLIFLTWITVTLSCDDWHNRFFLTVTPYLLILSLPVVDKLLSNFSKKSFKSPADLP